MEYNLIVSNFCEKKLFPYQPEYINSFSALFISIMSSYKIQNCNYPYTITLFYLCTFINGIYSFLYHWYGWYVFKLCDEFTMVVPLWLGISTILMEYEYPVYIVGILTVYNTILLVMDTFMWFDRYFPIFFGAEIVAVVPLYFTSIRPHICINRDVVYSNDEYYDKSIIVGKKGILLCTISGLIWIITEKFCNVYFLFGHAVWHIGMICGINYIVDFFYA